MEALRHHHHPHVQNQFSMELPASHEQVKQAQRRERARPSFLRVIIRLITLAVGASILGVLAAATAVWYMTRNTVLSQPERLPQPGWPQGMDIKPTYVLLAAAAIGIIVQILALLTLIGPVRRLRESRLHSWAVFFTSLAGIVLWVAAVVYYKTQDIKKSANWTLWSWSCTHKDWENGKMSFTSMCVKLNYSFYAAIAVAVLEIVSLLLFGHKLRNVKKQTGGYTKITVQQMG